MENMDVTVAMQPQETAVSQKGKAPKKKAKRIISTVINVLLILAIIVAAFCTYVSYVSTSGNGVPSLFGIEFLSVQTDSMYPTIKSGDMVIDKKVKDIAALQKDDIITYWTIINGERVLNTHRISQIYDGGEYRVFETKGDANSAVDTLTVHEKEVVGVYMFRIGGLGKVFDYLQTSTGFLVVIVIPVILFFIFHLVQFLRVLFEYQNIKNRLKYEQERGSTEEMLSKARQEEQNKIDAAKAEMEAELRRKIMEELKAEAQKSAESNTETAGNTAAVSGDSETTENQE